MALTNCIGAFFQLLGDRGPGLIVLRRMARVVAINTADRDFAVAVWTGKVQPQANLVEPRREYFFESAVEGMVALPAPEFIQMWWKIHHSGKKRVNKKLLNSQGISLSFH